MTVSPTARPSAPAPGPAAGTTTYRPAQLSWRTPAEIAIGETVILLALSLHPY